MFIRRKTENGCFPEIPEIPFSQIQRMKPVRDSRDVCRNGGACVEIYLQENNMMRRNRKCLKRTIAMSR